MKANASYNPTWEEEMQGPDYEGFWEACEEELKTLIDMDSWDVVDRDSSMKVLGYTWAFKRKRYPDGRVRNVKSIFCVIWDQQIDGVDCFDTFAPVVQWITIRLILILSEVLGMVIVQVDYIAAFIHAPKEETVYVEMPRGFSRP